MSISEFFNRKSRAVIAAVTLALGAGAGYVGHETAQSVTQPRVSEFTLQQLPDNTTEEQFISGRLPANAKFDALQPVRVDEFSARIDAMEQQKTAMATMADDDRSIATVRLLQDGISFVNDLRLAENLSERNYADLVADYTARVGVDVTPWTGNYTQGINYQQDAQLGVMFGMIFGDEDDKTDAQISREVGDTMLEGAKMNANAGLAGGAAGLLVGGLLAVPLWRRRHPKVGK